MLDLIYKQDAIKLAENFASASREVGKNVQDIVRLASESVERWSKKTMMGYSFPVFDTGLTRKSIFPVYTSKTRAEIGPKTSYAIYPHEGWSTSRRYGPRQYMYAGAGLMQKLDLPKFMKQTGDKIAMSIVRT